MIRREVNMFQDVLDYHLKRETVGCIVNRWIAELDQEDKQGFEKLMELTKNNSKAIDVKLLYDGIRAKTELPFRLTAFRSHMRGYCVCP